MVPHCAMGSCGRSPSLWQQRRELCAAVGAHLRVVYLGSSAVVLWLMMSRFAASDFSYR